MAKSLNTSLTPELNRLLAEKLNAEMRSTVMPVTVFVGIEAVFGFCGNILILYVFLFHYHKCNFKYFVLLLSFVDTTSTLTTLPGEIVTQTFWYVYPVSLVVVCKIKSFFNMFTVCGCAFGLLVISIDRFRKVCRPLQWQIKPKYALIMIFALLLASFLISIPVPFFWGLHSYNRSYEGYNITVTVCEIDAKFINTHYPVKYSAATETILSMVMFIMLVLYIFICRKLLRVKASGKKRANPAEYSQNPCSNGGTISGERGNGYGDDDDEYSGQGRSNDLKDTADTTDTQCSAVGGVPTVFPDPNPAGHSPHSANSPSAPAETNISSVSMANNSSALASKRRTRMASRRLSRRTKIRRKTLIMLILTALFIFTTILYLTCLSFIANGVLKSMTKTQKSVYFFFFRLYFINHVINPILYGILDPKFRRIFKQTLRSLMCRCCSRKPFHIDSI